ncbi:phycobiliprotein lyase [Ancylothrix sp. C2]|uniref:phycobiliprotein lyase n=1 Tax=Ancylothrix sp. D3o TaxID=2953691 RepID=UPI0021BA7237|nr:phycobiliprotein lyase [Ancylothrix sp. D3o]MCT7950847.1 phycobiliprotein lyase [Ancylothrix sp. D3o]
MNAMEFFEKSAGKWISQRGTHHLPFRRAELGDSEITVETLAADDPKVAEICELHGVAPNLAAGGAFVKWQGVMQWDKEDENHSGETVFAIVPDAEDPNKGKMLRERGYAEIVPVAGEYIVDEDGALILITEYETMSSVERFWFAAPNVRMRTSTVKRFGGFSTASFCTETRVIAEAENSQATSQPASNSQEFYSVLGW